MKPAVRRLAALLCIGLFLSSCAREEVTDVEVEIRTVGMDRTSGAPVIVLQDTKREMALPIWIGANEAQAIAMEMEGVTPPRPMTHDLMKNVLEEAGIAMDRVVIAALQDNTYYARLHLEAGGREVAIDSRPSDAIALAVRFRRPIFIARSLFEGKSGIDLRKTGNGGVVHLRGVSVQSLSSELAEHFGLAPGDGVLVSGVSEQVSDIHRGDVIVAIDGIAVIGVSDFADKIDALGGDPADLSVQRNGRRFEVRLRPDTG